MSPSPDNKMITPEHEPMSLSQISEYDRFTRDDLEFRTITTALNALDCRERITLQNFEVVPRMRPYLKILSGLSSLLVRNHEIVAILPKRSRSGVALLIGSDATPFNNESDFPSPSPSPTQSDGESLTHYVTRNPRRGEKVGVGVELVAHSAVTVGLELETFIMSNWQQSFEHHVQTFGDLLNAAFKKPGLKTANALKLYSTFRSAPKILRRLRNSEVLHELTKIDVTVHLEHTLGILTDIECDTLAVALYRDREARKLHPNFYSYVTNREGRLAPLRFDICHKFFTWLLSELDSQISILCTLQTKEKPDVFPTALLKSTLQHLEMLQYLAWESGFFNKYIASVLPSSAGHSVIPTSRSDTTIPFKEHEEGDAAGDFGTEFETEEDPQLDTNFHQSPVLHATILKLRLITSNIHQLEHLLSRLPLRDMRFNFQVLQYGRAGQQLKPWSELVQELFPNSDEGHIIQRELEKRSGYRNSDFRMFRNNGSSMIFRGEAHCEAILGCIYTLARTRDTVDISWTNIPRGVLSAAKNSYSLVAPSKRCCPVCACIISYLEPDDGPPLQALSTHSVVFPCALPIGLPHPVRQRLLITYRSHLKARLRALMGPDTAAPSSASIQSQPLSDHSTNAAQSPYYEHKKVALSIMQDWEELSTENVITEWGSIRTELSRAVVEACWWWMRDDYKSVLTPP